MGVLWWADEWVDEGRICEKGSHICDPFGHRCISFVLVGLWFDPKLSLETTNQTPSQMG